MDCKQPPKSAGPLQAGDRHPQKQIETFRDQTLKMGSTGPSRNEPSLKNNLTRPLENALKGIITETWLSGEMGSRVKPSAKMGPVIPWNAIALSWLNPPPVMANGLLRLPGLGLYPVTALMEV